MGRILKLAASASLIAGLAAAAVPGAAASSDIGKGASLFRTQCGSCHSDTAGARRGIGPNLFDIVGRRAGMEKGYDYSPAMKNAGLTWTTDKLKLYVANPKEVVPGDKMPYGGLHNPGKVDQIVAYLATLK